MIEWWNNLSLASGIFWCIALGASLMQIFLFFGSMVGAGDLDTDTGADAHDVGGGLKLLSLRALVAFGVGFGWAGGLAKNDGWSTGAAMLLAIAVGLVFMAAIYAVMHFMMKLQADGTLNYKNAIGLVGQVYVTVPANHAGQGQIELTLQGRMITASAVTRFSSPLLPQATAQVVDIEGNNILVVEPL